MKNKKDKKKTTTEAVEVTVLRELGGDWSGENLMEKEDMEEMKEVEKGRGEVFELSATRSKRNSRGGKSVRSLKAVSEMIRR